MENIVELGKTIKRKRLSLNMTMDQLAKEANISRATLWHIEMGEGNFSAQSLFKVLQILNISFSLIGDVKKEKRERASRLNKARDKKINRFVVMCIQQYADSVNKDNTDIYRKMLNKGIIDNLINDYEDLHGMSQIYLNNYISELLGA